MESGCAHNIALYPLTSSLLVLAHLAASRGSRFFLFLVQLHELATLILEHLVEFVGASLHILVVLMDEQGSQDKRVKSFQVVSARILLLFGCLVMRLCATVTRHFILVVLGDLLVVVEQRLMHLGGLTRAG